MQDSGLQEVVFTLSLFFNFNLKTRTLGVLNQNLCRCKKVGAFLSLTENTRVGKLVFWVVLICSGVSRQVCFVFQIRLNDLCSQQQPRAWYTPVTD